MQSIQKLREELDVNMDMTGLMDVLKGIAMSEFWAMAKKQGRFARFMNAFNGFFNILNFSGINHPYARPEGRLAILMITSNEGFMGGLNTRVIAAAMDNPQAEESELLIVGEQGAARLGALNRTFTAFPGVDHERRFEASIKLRDYIVEETRRGTFGRLMVYYPKPVSFMVQKVEELQILPAAELFQKKEMIDEEEIKDVIVESSLHDMIQYLAEAWIVQKLYEVFEDSKLAEFSARTVHLEESSQLLQGQTKGVRHKYIRRLHELIDKDMRDIFSAQIVKKRMKRRHEAEVRLVPVDCRKGRRAVG